MKAIVALIFSIAPIIAAVLSGSSPCRAQFTLQQGGAGEISGSAGVYANRVLKRRLQSDKRLAVADVAREFGGAADVYGSLPFEEGQSQLHLILGRYQSFGQGDGAAENINDKSNLEIASEVNNLKGKADQKRLAHTKISAEKLLLGTAAVDVKVLDEINAPPVMEGAGSILRKTNSLAGASTEAFDLAMSTRFGAALRLLNSALMAIKNGAQENQTAAGTIRLTNNYVCLLALNGNLPEAVKEMEAALEQHPQFGEADIYPIEVLNQVNIYLAHKEAKKALAALAKFESNKLSGRLGLNFWHSRVRAYEISGQLEEYQHALEQMVKLYPNNALALTTAGDAAMQKGDYKKALTFFDIAAGLNKNSIQPLLKMALCQAKLGDLDSALRSATSAVSSAPQDAEAHVTLGKLHLDNKEYLGARLQFERALELKPPFSVKRTAFTPLIKVLDVMNDDKELLRQLTAWVQENPEQPVTHYNRAFFLAGKKQEAEAIIEYEKAISLSPRFNKARYNLALLYRQYKENDKAKEQLRALLQAPDSKLEQNQAEQLLSSFN